LLERIWDACHEVTFLESVIICAFECPLHENNTLLSIKTKFIQDSSIHQWQTSLAKCCVVPTSIHDFSLFVVFGLVQWMAVLKLLALSFLSLCASLRWCQHSYEILASARVGWIGSVKRLMVLDAPPRSEQHWYGQQYSLSTTYYVLSGLRQHIHVTQLR